jgi:hypothetical protein
MQQRGRRGGVQAVLADRDAVEDADGIEWDERYTWKIGGPNDIPCVHLKDVYRGAEPLEEYMSPFCTKSSCPMPGAGARTPLSLARTFVSDDDRVLLKSMAFGCVGDGDLLLLFAVGW